MLFLVESKSLVEFNYLDGVGFDLANHGVCEIVNGQVAGVLLTWTEGGDGDCS
jgi:hypothetical protein